VVLMSKTQHKSQRNCKMKSGTSTSCLATQNHFRLLHPNRKSFNSFFVPFTSLCLWNSQSFTRKESMSILTTPRRQDSCPISRLSIFNHGVTDTQLLISERWRICASRWSLSVERESAFALMVPKMIDNRCQNPPIVAADDSRSKCCPDRSLWTLLFPSVSFQTLTNSSVTDDRSWLQMWLIFWTSLSHSDFLTFWLSDSDISTLICSPTMIRNPHSTKE
jgi:hypothetical protein